MSDEPKNESVEVKVPTEVPPVVADTAPVVSAPTLAAPVVEVPATPVAVAPITDVPAAPVIPAAPVSSTATTTPTPAAKIIPKIKIRHKKHLVHAYLLFFFLIIIGASGWIFASIFGRSVVNAAASLAASTVPDEALSAAFLLERRSQIDADAAALDKLFILRSNPVPLLSEIETRAKVAEAVAEVSSVAVAPYDGKGDPSFSEAVAGGEERETEYALVIVSLQAKGSWKSVITFARSLEELPYTARVERLKLSVETGEKGVSVWTLRAEVRAIAR